MYHIPLNEELKQEGLSESREEQVITTREKVKQEI
jgi:hypothetical protein